MSTVEEMWHGDIVFPIELRTHMTVRAYLMRNDGVLAIYVVEWRPKQPIPAGRRIDFNAHNHFASRVTVRWCDDNGGIHLQTADCERIGERFVDA